MHAPRSSSSGCLLALRICCRHLAREAPPGAPAWGGMWAAAASEAPSLAGVGLGAARTPGSRDLLCSSPGGWCFLVASVALAGCLSSHPRSGQHRGSDAGTPSSTAPWPEMGCRRESVRFARPERAIPSQKRTHLLFSSSKSRLDVHLFNGLCPQLIQSGKCPGGESC